MTQPVPNIGMTLEVYSQIRAALDPYRSMLNPAQAETVADLMYQYATTNRNTMVAVDIAAKTYVALERCAVLTTQQRADIREAAMNIRGSQVTP